MGITPAAVRQAKSRVLRRLKEELGELNHLRIRACPIAICGGSVARHAETRLCHR